MVLLEKRSAKTCLQRCLYRNSGHDVAKRRSEAICLSAWWTQQAFPLSLMVVGLCHRRHLQTEDLKYCIFGLGDSHYWGKGTEARGRRVESRKVHRPMHPEAAATMSSNLIAFLLDFADFALREESKFNFAKPARDLDDLLEKLSIELRGHGVMGFWLLDAVRLRKFPNCFK